MAVILALVAYQAAITPMTPYDEPLWYRRAQVPIAQNIECAYDWAVDVPGGCRLLYGTALDVWGLDGLPYRMPDYAVTWQENLENGCYAPADAVLLMRGCNMLMFICGLVCLYLVSYMALRRPVLALLPLAPLVLSPTFPVEIVPRVGPDAILMVGLCLFLLAWATLDRRGQGRSWTAVVTLGVLGGIAAWTKINGALMLIGYLGYMVAVTPRGRGAVKGLVALAIGGAVFYLLNPALIGHNPIEVFVDILQRRAVAGAALDKIYGTMGWTAVFAGAVKCWPLVPIIAWAVWKARVLPGMAPVFWWAVAVVIGNLVLINLPLARYLGPIELGLYFTGALSVIAVVRSYGR